MLSGEEFDRVWRDYPNYLPSARERTGRFRRSAFNAIRTFHPDEYVIFKGLARMRPGRLDFFHGFFGWPSLQFYVTGAGLIVARMFGFASLVRDTGFYFRDPAEMARLYVVGRFITLLMSMAAILFVWYGMRRLYGRTAANCSALFLAVCPLLTVNAHYMTADAPMLLWVAVCFWASTYILRRENVRWYFVAGAAVGLAAATRYQGALAGFVVFSAHAFRGRPPDPVSGRPASGVHNVAHVFLDSRLWLSGLMAIVVFLLTNVYALKHPILFWRELAQEFTNAQSAGVSLTGCAAAFVWYALGPGLAVAAAFGLVIAWRRRRQRDWFLFFGFAPALVFLLASRPIMARYWMPALILPVALAGRGLGEWISPGPVESGPVRRASAWVLVILVFFSSLAQSAAYAQMYARTDPRIVAGRWIEKNTPDGSKVALLAERENFRHRPPQPLKGDPWQFQLPPLNAGRMKLVGLPMSKELLVETDPDFVVVSDYQFPPLANREPLSMPEWEFLDVLRDKSAFEKLRFRNYPSLLGMRFDIAASPPPLDLRYADPGITIYRKRKGR